MSSLDRMTDANAWLPLKREERRDLALDCLAKLYDGRKDVDGTVIDVRDLFIEHDDAVWSSESATGDAMFLPGQFRSHFEAARRPEGNIFFAGEHLSRHHTWIAGAIESTLEAVRAATGRHDLQPLRGSAPSYSAPASAHTSTDTLVDESKSAEKAESKHEPPVKQDAPEQQPPKTVARKALLQVPGTPAAKACWSLIWNVLRLSMAGI